MTVKSAPKDDYFFVNARLGDKTNACLLFDTGTYLTLLREDVARKLPFGNSELAIYIYTQNSPRDYLRIKLPFLPKFHIGYSKRTNITIDTITSLKKNMHVYKKGSDEFLYFENKYPNMQGILGWDFIKKYNWVLDVKRRKAKPISLYSEYCLSDEMKMLVLKITKESPTPYVKITIEKKCNKAVVFDTGADGFLYIDRNIFAKKEEESQTSTFWGIFKTRYVTLNSINVNGYNFQNVEVETFSEKPNFENILGMDFISRFDKVIIDNTNKQILFLKNK